MRNQIFFSGILSAFLIIFAPKCPANIVNQLMCDLHPFVGIDAQARHMGFEEAFGGNIFKKTIPQYDIYAGVRFLRYFGIDIGYEQSKIRNRTSEVAEGSTLLGVLILPGEGNQVHATETQIRGPHVDLLGFWPICPRYCVELFGSIGLVRNMLSLEDFFLAVAGIPEEDPLKFTFTEKKTNLRASIGLQKLFRGCFGVRALVAWEDTSRFNHISPSEDPTSLFAVKARRSVNYGVGIFAMM